MPALQYINLSNNQLGSEGLKNLCSGGNWPSLKILNLGKYYT
jgi:hypothetical protein